MTNRNPCSYLSSADNKKSIQVTGHYSVHIGIAPSSKLTGFLRKYHYQKYVSLPRATATHFARHSSLLTLTSVPDFGTPSYEPSYIKKKAGISWRVRIVAPHIPHVLYAFVYEIVKVHSQASACILDKINSGLISPKST